MSPYQVGDLMHGNGGLTGCKSAWLANVDAKAWYLSHHHIRYGVLNALEGRHLELAGHLLKVSQGSYVTQMLAVHNMSQLS